MKPTQEQVIAWAREAGIKRCDCDPRCHLQTGGIGCITALVTIAYEAGRKDENEACAKVLDEMADDMLREMEPSTAIEYVRRKAATIRARVKP